MRRSLWPGVLAAVAAGLSGCSGDKGAVKEDDAEITPTEQVRESRAGNEKVTEYDLNKDGKPDVWTFVADATDEEGRKIERLVKKELDINWDQKVDIVRHYDEREQVQRELLDLDFDGKVDQMNHYEKGVVVRKERDLDYDGKPDLWVHFDRGRIVRKERDTNGDGRVDYWEYWENDEVDRIGEDVDGDGTVDRWTRNPNTQPTE